MAVNNSKGLGGGSKRERQQEVPLLAFEYMAIEALEVVCAFWDPAMRGHGYESVAVMWAFGEKVNCERNLTDLQI